MTKKQLYADAQKLGIPGRSKMDKAALEAAVMAAQQPPPGQEVVLMRDQTKELIRYYQGQTRNLDRAYLRSLAESLGVEIKGRELGDVLLETLARTCPERVFGIYRKQRTSAVAVLFKALGMEDVVFLTENQKEEEYILQNEGIEVLLNIDGIDDGIDEEVEEEESGPRADVYYRAKLWARVTHKKEATDALGIQPQKSGARYLKALKYAKQLCAPNRGETRLIKFDPKRVRVMPPKLAKLYDGANFVRLSILGRAFDGKSAIVRVFHRVLQLKGGLVGIPDECWPEGVDWLVSENKKDVLPLVPEGMALLVINSKWSKVKEAATDLQTLVNNFLVNSPEFNKEAYAVLLDAATRFETSTERIEDVADKAVLAGLEEHEYRDATTEILGGLKKMGLPFSSFPRPLIKGLSRCLDGTIDIDRARMPGGRLRGDVWVPHVLGVYIQVHPGEAFEWLWRAETDTTLRKEHKKLPFTGDRLWLLSHKQMKPKVLYTDEGSAWAIHGLHGKEAGITRSPNTMTGGAISSIEALPGTPQCTYWVKPDKKTWAHIFDKQDTADLDDRFLIWLGKWAKMMADHWHAFKAAMDGDRFLSEKAMKHTYDSMVDPAQPWNLDNQGEPIKEGNIARIEEAIRNLEESFDGTPLDMINQAAVIQRAFKGMIGYAANWQMFMAMALQGLIQIKAVKHLNHLAQAVVSTTLSDIIDCENQGANPELALKAMRFFAATARYIHFKIEEAVDRDGKKQWHYRNLVMPKLAVRRAIGPLKRALMPVQEYKNGKPVLVEHLGEVVPQLKTWNRGPQKGQPWTRFRISEPQWMAYEKLQAYIAWVQEEVTCQVEGGLETEIMARFGKAALVFLRSLSPKSRAGANALYGLVVKYNREREALSKAFGHAMRMGADVDTEILAREIGDLNDRFLRSSWPEDTNDQALMILAVMAKKWSAMTPLTPFKLRLERNNLAIHMPGFYDEVLWLQDLVPSHFEESEEVDHKNGPWRRTLRAMEFLEKHVSGMELTYEVECFCRKGRKSSDYLETVFSTHKGAQAKLKAAMLEANPQFHEEMQFEGQYTWEVVPAASRRHGTLNARWRGRHGSDDKITRDNMLKKIRDRKILDIKFVRDDSRGQCNLLVILER